MKHPPREESVRTGCGNLMQCAVYAIPRLAWPLRWPATAGVIEVLPRLGTASRHSYCRQPLLTLQLPPLPNALHDMQARARRAHASCCCLQLPLRLLRHRAGSAARCS